jgi:hypothetical protein
VLSFGAVTRYIAHHNLCIPPIANSHGYVKGTNGQNITLMFCFGVIYFLLDATGFSHELGLLIFLICVLILSHNTRDFGWPSSDTILVSAMENSNIALFQL